jgi:tight adherence protein B
MGALLGLLLGVGLLMVLRAGTPRSARPGDRLSLHQRATEKLAQAGLSSITPARLAASSLALSVVVLLIMFVVSRSVVIALAFAGLAGYAPVGLVGVRHRRRQVELRDLWPDAVDNLASAVRAGLSLPEALSQLGVRGPEGLRPAFSEFGEDYRATGRFSECLDGLKVKLADPVGDRVVEALRTAREVGGSDLGRLLRTLSAFLREDSRTRAELESRQSWTINAARLAVAAPWILLLLLSFRPEAVRAYDSAAGLVVLGFGAALCLVSYRVMLKIGRLPREERVLR